MRNDIEITGITPITSFPKCPPYFPSNQICETDILCVPLQKPKMESILQVKVNISVCSHKVICTPVGKKLVIDGIKHITIIYVADVPCQSVHSAHFNIPFCMFVLLNELDCKVVDVSTVIEDIKINQLDCRCFSLSVIIFACPKLKNECDYCGHEKPICKKRCIDDCEGNCFEHRCKDYDDCTNNCYESECQEHNDCDSNYHEYGCDNNDDCTNNCYESECQECNECDSNYHECGCDNNDDCINNCYESECQECNDCGSNYHEYGFKDNDDEYRRKDYEKRDNKNYKYSNREYGDYLSNRLKHRNKEHKKGESKFDFLYLTGL
jgi:hypothetical protein